jgi:hypothetical protein
MKILSAYYQPHFKVYCSACGFDEWVEFHYARKSKLYSKDDAVLIRNQSTPTPYYLELRLKASWQIIKDYFKGKKFQNYNTVILDTVLFSEIFDNLLDLYNLLKISKSIPSISSIDEIEISRKNHFWKAKGKKAKEDPTTYIITVFQSEEITLELDISEIEGKKIIHDAEISIGRKFESLKDVKRQVVRNVIRKSNDFISDDESILSESEFVDFIAIFKFLVLKTNTDSNNQLYL